MVALRKPLRIVLEPSGECSLGVAGKMRVSIGIPAYNEEKNLGNLLAALLDERTKEIEVNEIIVVLSGCTDRSDVIVKKFCEIDDRIILIRQEGRKGKASAINELVKVAGNDVLVLESADTVPGRETIERLCRPLIDEGVGMVGAHTIPINSKETLMGYVVHLLWGLHQQIAAKKPKCGELVAFRKVFDSIPEDMAVDEAWIEYEITRRGYKVAYAPEAVVYNKGPETTNDFLKQRRRIAYGHIDLQKRTKYRVSSWSPSLLLWAIREVFPFRAPKKWPWFFAACALEGVGRFLGYCDYYIHKRGHAVWEVAQTTKLVEIERGHGA